MKDFLIKRDETNHLADEILRKHEDKNEFHFYELDRSWIIEAMEEYAKLRQDLTIQFIEENSIDKSDLK